MTAAHQYSSTACREYMSCLQAFALSIWCITTYNLQYVAHCLSSFQCSVSGHFKSQVVSMFSTAGTVAMKGVVHQQTGLKSMVCMFLPGKVVCTS